MKLRQLQDFFPPERQKDIEALFNQFVREQRGKGGGESVEDVEAFVMSLHERELITTDTLRDILIQH